jgi:glycosyltransferase involved in cell wall biosynthesis
VPTSPRPTIRVVLTQPTLTKYRVPVFKELASRPGIDLLVVHGEETNMPTAKPDGFRTRLVPLRERIAGSEIFRWHDAQIDFCSPDHADAVVLSWSSRYLSLLPGLARARWNGVGSVLWGHGYSKAETRLRDWSRATLSGLADALLFYNHGAAQLYIDSQYAPAESVFVALNTIDQAPIRAAIASWTADPARLREFKARERLDTGPIILFVSRLNPWNRTEMLVRAAGPLRERFPGVQVVIVGDGPDLERLRRAARDAGVENAVRFTGAVYGEEQLAPWFLSASVFAYPANIGLSLIHAMCYSLPIVTSRLQRAQNPEIEAFRDGYNGLGYDDGSQASLEQCLTRVLADDALRQDLALNAGRTVLNNYTITTMADGLEAAVRHAAYRMRQRRRS